MARRRKGGCMYEEGLMRDAWSYNGGNDGTSRRKEKDIFQPLHFHPGLLRRLPWTQEKPTVEGMYWCRCIDPCRRIAGPANIMYYTPGCTLVDMYDEFAGPIQEPYDLAIGDHIMSKELKPFQRVLVRDDDTAYWGIDFFKEYAETLECPYVCLTNSYKQCLPYNNEIKHLLGTDNSPTPPEPEFRFGDKVEVCFSKGENWIQAIFFNRVGKLYSAITRGSDKAYMYQFCRHANW